jgi:hypothetical protein
MSNAQKTYALAGSTRRVRKGASRAAAADPNETLHLSVYLRRPPNASPLLGQKDFAARPLARHRQLSRQQLADQHGATAHDIHAVTSFCADFGLTVEEVAPERRLVRVSGTVAQISKAFSVDLYNYESPKEKYRGHEGPVHVPASLAGIVQGVFGLDNRSMARRAGGGVGVGNVTPPQVAKAYNFPTNLATNQTVAVLEFSGPTPAQFSCGFAQSDIDGYISFLNTTTGTTLSTIAVTPVPVDPSSTNPGDLPGGSATNFNIDTDADVEVALDLEIIVSLAQGAKVVAYFAPATEQGWVDAITQIVADATNHPDVLSISWGWAELESAQDIDLGSPFSWPFEWTQAAFTQMTQAFQDAANIGMTVFVSAGDAGSDCNEDDGNAHVLYPASDPWVTSCGGTTITGLSPLQQDTWNDDAIDPGAATGGGISYLASKPSWQADANVPPSVNPDHHVGRGIPDVAGNADFNSGYLLFLYGTTSDKLFITAPPLDAGSPLGPVGGTSAVGPLYASLIARINASLNTRVGYLNPTLYELGTSGVFNDINDGVSNSVTTASGGTSPGYTSGPDWDACTGWGTIDGGALLSALQPIYKRSVSLILDRSTFGQDEVSAGLKNSKATPPTDLFQDAFYVVVEGYTPTELGLTATNLDTPPNFPVFSGSFSTLGDPAIAFDATTGVQLEDSSELDSVQRITYPYNVTFSSVNAFIGLSLTNPTALYGLSATITNAAVPGYPAVTAQPSPTGEFELAFQADPFMDHGETWWLSNDMRVFQFTPAILPPSGIPLAYSSTAWTGDANTYIHNLIQELNKSFTDPTLTNTPFSGISSDEYASYLNLTGTDGHGHDVYNFGLARVHLQGDTAMNVRTFFRLFISSSPDTDFSTTTTFRSAEETDPTTGGPITGTLIPLLGFPDSDMSSTIPFFAAPRIVSTSLPMTAQTDPDNVQTIPSPTAPAPVPGAEVYAYFGCWLDLNQGTAQFPVNPNTQAKPDGPYPAAEILSIPALIMSDHSCLVAEIAYAQDPIPAGANASTSDKIGQRNLSWTPSGNPGPIEGHVVPTLFDLKLTSPEIPEDQLPDELMIEWGQVPAGSIASIYWPQVDAAQVLELADRHYALNLLTKKDAHTLQVTTGTLTYIPIPPGTGPNLAGLLTIDLPATVRTGQQFDVVVRRLRTRLTKDRDNNANSAAAADVNNDVFNWRYVVGAFQIRIPVAADPILLPPEESLLALFKWKIDAIPSTNRWSPVLKRYIQQVSGRVDAYGGNASGIPPSQIGYPGVQKIGHHPDRHEHTGKVSGIIYDRFGDFEAFTLLSEHGVEHLYLSREEEIQQLIRMAWGERIVISVFASRHHPEHPTAIVLRRTAGPI